MKALTSLLASLALVIGVSGCSVTNDPAPPTVTYGPVINDEAYAQRIRIDAPELAHTSTRALVQNAEAVCEGFDRGVSVKKTTGVIVRAGLQRSTARVLINGAVSYKCIDHKAMLK